MALGDLFIRLVDERCDGLGLEVASPRERQRRGSQVSLRHSDGYRVMRALIGRGAIGDFGTPDLMGFGLNPLYTRYVDGWHAILARCLVLATSAGAAIFTFIGMRDPGRLPDGLAVLTAFLALFVPLALTYASRLLTGQPEASPFDPPTN